MKAPTAAGNPPATAPDDASSAAPGVDQAIAVGMRVRRLNHTDPAPASIVTAISPDAACAGLAPTASSPRSTTANVLANPTKVARNPAATVVTEISRCMTRNPNRR